MQNNDIPDREHVGKVTLGQIFITGLNFKEDKENGLVKDENFWFECPLSDFTLDKDVTIIKCKNTIDREAEGK